MSALLIEPDYKSATKNHLVNSEPGKAALEAIKPNLPDWISNDLYSGKDAPKHYVSILRAGGFGRHPYVPLAYPRLDILCYGSSTYEAARVARTVKAILVPEGYGAINGFDDPITKCRVQYVRVEGDLRDDKTPEGWPICFFSVIMTITTEEYE